MGNELFLGEEKTPGCGMSARRQAYKVAVILPAYNEQLTIAATIEDFRRELPDAEIWVINNRSTDATADIARKTLLDLNSSGGVINEGRPGKGSAIRRALIDVTADIYLLADADLTYPAAHARDLIAPIIADEADMVVGDRHSSGSYAAENKRPLHGFGNCLVRDMVNIIFRSKLADIMSGYRAMSRRFARSYPILVEGFEIETDMTLHALDKRFRILEIPIGYRDRPDGSFSKLDTFSDGARVIGTIINIMRHYRPLLFFGMISMSFGLLGLAAAIPVINDWLTESYIYHVPLAILATGLEITAIVLAAVGLILDSINHQDRRNFERDLVARRHE